MAAGQKIKGKDGVIQLSDGTTTEEIPCLTSFTLDTSASITSDSSACMLSNGDGGSDADADWETQTVESRSWSFSTEHQWQKDDAVGTTGIADLTNVGQTVAAELYPNKKDGAGNRIYSGNAIIESVSVPSEVNGVITQSISYKGDGPLTKALTV